MPLRLRILHLFPFCSPEAITSSTVAIHKVIFLQKYGCMSWDPHTKQNKFHWEKFDFLPHTWHRNLKHWLRATQSGVQHKLSHKLYTVKKHSTIFQSSQLHVYSAHMKFKECLQTSLLKTLKSSFSFVFLSEDLSISISGIGLRDHIQCSTL